VPFARIRGEFMLGMADELSAHLVRALVLVEWRNETDVLGHLRTVAKCRPNSEAFIAWAEGLLTEGCIYSDPRHDQQVSLGPFGLPRTRGRAQET
jgi:hypothetical protein